jgi:hypothetical protein
MFNLDVFYAALIDGNIAGIVALNDGTVPAVKLNKKTKTSYQKSIGKRKIFFITLKKEKTYLQTGVKGKMNALQRALDTVLKI